MEPSLFWRAEILLGSSYSKAAVESTFILGAKAVYDFRFRLANRIRGAGAPEVVHA